MGNVNLPLITFARRGGDGRGGLDVPRGQAGSQRSLSVTGHGNSQQFSIDILSHLAVSQNFWMIYIMSVRRCEYCCCRIAEGKRVDAVYCTDDCRVNAHKKRKRDIRKEWLLREEYRPIFAYPFSESWQVLLDEMGRSCPVGGAVAGYRLKKRGSIYPNPQDPLRVVDGELVSLTYYRWKPFEPPSVPEIGHYQLQWSLDGEFYAAAFDTEGISTCFVPIADPQARFHNNHVTRETLSAPAWKRQVNAKLKPLRAEIERAKADKANGGSTKTERGGRK